MKKVAIDARPLSRPRSGIRRYLENILEILLEKPETQWYLYSDKPLLSNIVQPHHNAVVRVARGKKLARFTWSWFLRKWVQKDSPDTYWSPRHHLPRFLPCDTRKIVTIHDLVWVNLPATMRVTSLIAERLKTPYSIKVADTIIAVSESTAADIRALAPESSSKIVVLHHGRSNLPDLSKEPLDRYLNDPYFLSVGTIEPRKNFNLLLRAYSEYLESGGVNDLVIAGNRGWGWAAFQKQLALLNLGSKFRFIENCDDEVLSRLYKHAEAFVMVSLGEGYGLPVAEAEQFKIPMLLSDLAVFREINPTRVLWVDQTDPLSIAKALAEFHTPHPTYSESKMEVNRVQDWADIADKLFFAF